MSCPSFITPRRGRRARGGEYTFLIVAVVVSILLVLVLLFVWYSQATAKGAAIIAASVPDPSVPQPPSPSKLQKFTSAAVCTDGPPCSEIGRDILKKGGSAVDAAIAALFCNGLYNSQSMGIGGGFMMTAYINGTGYSITARETAPEAAHREMFVANASLSRTGGLSVGVPGELVGYWEVWQKFGQLEWNELIEPSIELCKQGYIMNQAQYDSIFFRRGIFDRDPIFKDMFFDLETNKFHKPGSIIKPKKICETYETIAKEGGMALNNGSLTEVFVQDIRDHGGIITEDDMRSYRVDWSKPVSFNLSGGFTVLSSPPPASGILLGYILQVLDGFNITPPYSNISEAAEKHAVDSYLTILHRTIETYKFAFAQRGRFGDPKFIDMESVKKDLMSKDLANKTRSKMLGEKTSEDPRYYGAVSLSTDDHGTAHISVVSPNGDAVSVTSTINLYFGAGFVSKSTGIIPNSVMDDFSTPGVENYFNLKPSENNMIAPRKRPLSSACPTVVLHPSGDVAMAIGAAGGTKIVTAVSWVIMRWLWFNEDIKEAMDASRIHHQLYPMQLEYEYGYLAPLVEGLKKLGHKLERYRQRGSVVCAVTKNNGTIYANADFRKGGEVYGY